MSVSVSVCVCVRERERERKLVSMCVSNSMYACLLASVSMRVCLCEYISV